MGLSAYGSDHWPVILNELWTIYMSHFGKYVFVCYHHHYEMVYFKYKMAPDKVKYFMFTDRILKTNTTKIITGHLFKLK